MNHNTDMKSCTFQGLLYSSTQLSPKTSLSHKMERSGKCVSALHASETMADRHARGGSAAPGLFVYGLEGATVCGALFGDGTNR